MDNLFRFFRGESQTSSQTTFYSIHEAVDKTNDSDIIDESGFVVVDSQCSKITEEYQRQSSTKELLAKDTCSSPVESMKTSVEIKEEICSSNGPLNNMCNVPMRLSNDLQTFNKHLTYINNRQHLNLDSYNYDFSLEISVLSQNP